MTKNLSGFSRRRLEGSITLGERLSQLRMEAGLSIDQVSQHLGIARQHIQSIESGEYDKLPGEVYIRNFLSRYAKLLNVQEASVQKLFVQEFLLSNIAKPATADKSLPPQAISRRLVLTPTGIKRLGLGLLVLAILVYLGWEVSKIVSPPNLELSTPVENFVTSESLTAITGQTEPEAIIRINGEEIFVDKDGLFSETIVLEVGINTVQVEAKKPRSRTTTLYRQILYEVEQQ